MERRLEVQKHKVGSKEIKLQIPMLVNTIKIKKGDRLIVAKTAMDTAQKKEEPMAKRLKIMGASSNAADAAPPLAKGKGKGKGKGKTGKGNGK